MTGEKDYSLLWLDVALLGHWFLVTWGNMLPSSSWAQHSWTLHSWHCRHQVPVKCCEAPTQWQLHLPGNWNLWLYSCGYL